MRKKPRKVVGTAERMRLSVYRSLKHIYAQVIDDTSSQTKAACSSQSLKLKAGGNIEAAKQVGKAIAAQAIKRDIKKVCFDRGSFIYHGRIAALAKAAREEGLEF